MKFVSADVGGGRFGFAAETNAGFAITEIGGALEGAPENGVMALYESKPGVGEILWVVTRPQVTLKAVGFPGVPGSGRVRLRRMSSGARVLWRNVEADRVPWPPRAMRQNGIAIELYGQLLGPTELPAPEVETLTGAVEHPDIAADIVARINAVRKTGYHCVPEVSMQGNVLTDEQKARIPRCPASKQVEWDDILAAAADLTLDDWQAYPEAWGADNTAHLSHDGTKPDERLHRAEAAHFDRYPAKRWDGYAEIFTSFAASTEQVAERAVARWLDSFPHCQTLNSGGHVKADVIGVAVRERSPGQWAACAWFGEFNKYWQQYPNFFTW